MSGLLSRLPAAGWRADLAALGFGILAALAFPPLYVLPALLVAVPALLTLIGTASGYGGAFRRGFWFGFGQHLVGLYWITEAIMLESARYWWLVPIAVPALSAMMALFIAIPCAATRAATRTPTPTWHRVAMLAGTWTLGDLARQYVGTGFPWNPWGSVWALPGLAGDTMLQPAAWVGTPGLTLATVALAGLPLLGRRGWAGLAAALSLWAAAGTWRLRDPAPPGTGLLAILVQGNVAQGSKWDRAVADETFERYLRLSAEGVAAAGGKPTVVVWPETASPYMLGTDENARAAIAAAIAPAIARAAIAPAPGAPGNLNAHALGAIVGSLTFRDAAGTLVPPSREAEPFNSMIALDPHGTITGIYDKWHLVPFGEYAPSWVPLAVQIVPGHFGFGSGPATLRIPGIPPFGGLICYEAIFPAQVVDEAHRPDWLVNITNDAWFGNSTGPRQHLAAVRMRAVEEGIPVMRAANTGITAGFDGQGRELGRIPPNTAGQLTLAVPGKRPPTSFSRLGLVIPGLLALMAMGAGLTGRRNRP